MSLVKAAKSATPAAPAPATDTPAGIKNHSLAANTVTTGAAGVEAIIKLLAPLSVPDLVTLRYKLDSMLPTNLEDLDLGEELALQYASGRALLVDVQTDSTIPTNQKSQIFNAVRAQLADIVKQQESVWGMERLKKFEVAMVKAAGLLTEEARASFFDLYGHFLKNEMIGGTPVAEVGRPPAEPETSTVSVPAPRPLAPNSANALIADEVDRTT